MSVGSPGEANAVWHALLASVVAGLATTLGALPVLRFRSVSARTGSVLLGFGAGVMLAATAFALIAPALELHRERELPGHPLWSVWIGLSLGAFAVFLADRYVPHEHFVKGREGVDARSVKRSWLFVAAIGLHNLPEGLAVGAGFGHPDQSTGLVIATGIVLQNLPEGLIAALSLRAVGYSPWFSLGIAGLTGAVEVFGGLLGILTFTVADGLVPLALAFAGGAMLYVVCQEVIPEAYRRGIERPATFGLIAGFLVMLTLDETLG